MSVSEIVNRIPYFVTLPGLKTLTQFAARNIVPAAV